MIDIKIRLARLEDLSQICEIERASFPDPYPPLLLETLFVHSPEVFLVAVEGVRIVGYISACRKQRTVHIASIAVHPTHRRKSIAKELVATLIKKMTNMGVASITLEGRVSNTAAQNLYKSLGFRHSKTLKKYYENGEDAFAMELILQ